MWTRDWPGLTPASGGCLSLVVLVRGDTQSYVSSYCELKRATMQGLAILNALAMGYPRPRKTCYALGTTGKALSPRGFGRGPSP